MKVNLCQIEEMNLSCMGCCGHDFKTREELEEALRKNTLTYKEAKDKKEWGRRSPNFVRPCGLCYNIIKVDNKVFCPLHPSRNDGEELRDADCEFDYMCETFKKFKLWDEDKQKAFIEFLKPKKLDWYEYSMGMDSSSLLKEFEEEYKE